MKVQCLEFREGRVNVNVIVIVNLRSVATTPLMPSALRGGGDTSADKYGKPMKSYLRLLLH